MPELYLTRIQPNPPGRDRTRYSAPLNQQLNAEWVEFMALETRNLTGDELLRLTFGANDCMRTGSDRLAKFKYMELAVGRPVVVHTGSGHDGWEGSTFHVFLGRGNFVWNNGCGDRATIEYDGRTIDWAYYDPKPRDGMLTRIENTNKFA